MNVYVETNFVFELVFQQEQSSSCEKILQLGTDGKIVLYVPAYCLAEPHEKLNRQYHKRQELQKALEEELKQLKRSAPYTERIRSIYEVSSLIIQSNQKEKALFQQYLIKLLTTTRVLPLTADILHHALEFEKAYDLSSQDAIVYASVFQHIRQKTSLDNCFLNRNSKDFDNPDIVAELNQYNCKMIPRFDDGFAFIQKRLQ